MLRQFALLSCVVIQSVATSALAAACRDAPGTRTTTTTTTSLRKRDVDSKRAVALCKTTRESATGNASLSVGDALAVIGSENGNTDVGGDSDRTPRGDESNFGSNGPSRGGGSADRCDRDTGGRNFDGNHHDNGGGGGGGNGNGGGNSGPGVSDEDKSVEKKELFDVLLSPLTNEEEQKEFRETRISASKSSKYVTSMEKYILNSLSTAERADILAAIEDALRGGNVTKMLTVDEKAKAIMDMLFKFKVFVTKETAETLRTEGVDREKIQSWTPKDSESFLEHRVETTREQAKAAYVAQLNNPPSDEEIENKYQTWMKNLEKKLTSSSKTEGFRAYVDNTVCNYAYAVRRGESVSTVASTCHFYELFYNGIAGAVEGPMKRWKKHFKEILSPTVQSQTCQKVARYCLLTKPRSSSSPSDTNVMDDEDDDEDDCFTSLPSSLMDDFFEFYPVWIPTAENISEILSTFIGELKALYRRSGGKGDFIVPIGALALFPAFLSCFRELTTTLGFKTHETFETSEERKFSANVQMPLGSTRPPPVVLKMEATLTSNAFQSLSYVLIFYNEKEHGSDLKTAASEAKKNIGKAASLLQNKLKEWAKEYSPELDKVMVLPMDKRSKYDIHHTSEMIRRAFLKHTNCPLVDYVDSDYTRKSAARFIVHFFVEIAKKLRDDLFLSKDPSVRLCFLFGDINRKTNIRNSKNSFLVQLQNLLHGASGGEELIANVLLRAIAEKEFIECIIGKNTATEVWHDMILRAVSIVKQKQGVTTVSKFDADFPLFSMSARRSLENFVYLETDLGGKFHRFKTLTELWTERSREQIEKNDGFTHDLLSKKRWMLYNNFSKKMALDLMFSVIVMYIGINSSQSTYADEEKELMRSSEDARVRSFMGNFFKN